MDDINNSNSKLSYEELLEQNTQLKHQVLVQEEKSIKVEAKYQNIIESSPLGMLLYCLEEEDRLIFKGYNKSAETILGVELEGLIGKTIEEAFPPLAQTEIPFAYKKTAKTGEEFFTNQVDYDFDKIKGAYEVLAFQVSQNNIAVNFSDITERLKKDVEIKESQQKFKSLFDNVEEGVALHQLILDEDNNPIDFIWVDVNPTYEKITQLKKKDLIGKKGKEVIPNIEKKWYDLYAEVQLTGIPKTITDHSEYLNKYWEVKAFRPYEGHFAVAMTDVTEKVISEQKLKESERKFRILADNTNDWEYWIDENNEYVFISPSCEKITGYSEEEFYKNPDLFIELVREDYKDEVFNHYHDTNRTKPLFTSEFPIINKNNKEIWIEHSCVPILDDEGNFLGRRGRNRDITDKKNAENELKKSESIKQKMLSNIGDVIVIIDKNGINRYKSPNVKKLFGWEVEKLVGNSAWDKVHPDDIEGAKKLLADLAHEPNKSIITEVRYLRKDGEYRWIEITISNLLYDPEIGGFLGNYHDITERKLDEEALRSSQEMLLTSQSVANICSYSTDLIVSDIDKSQWECSPEFYKIFGIDETYPHTIKGWIGFLHPDYREDVAAYHESVVLEKKTFNREYKIIRINDGVERWVHGTGELVYDKNGKPIRMYGAIQDITESKQAELKLIAKNEELLKAEEQVSSSLQQIKIIQANTPNIIWKWDIDKEENFKNSYISEVADKFLALPKGSIGNSMTKFFSYILPEYLPLVNNAINNAIKNPNTLISIEYEVKGADGKLSWFSSTGKVVHENNKLTIYGTTIDITEKKQNEQKLVLSDTVFNLALDMFCIAGFDGYYKYLNPAWERTLGWNIEELLSKPWLDFVHPDDAENTENIKPVIVDGKEIYKFENRYICKDGSIKWLAWNSQPFPKENIMIGAVRDVTETKRIEKELIRAKENAVQSEANVKAIIEGTQNSVWAFDTKYRILYINNVMQNEFFQSFGILLKPGMNLVEALPEALQTYWKPRYDRVLANEQFAIEDAVPTNVGTIYIEVAFNPIIKDGQVIGGSCIGSDITVRKNDEKELLQAKEKAEENEEKLLEAQEISHVGSWEYIVTTDTVTWSKELYNIFEHSYELPAPKYSEQASFYTEESFAMLDKAVQDCVRNEIPYEIELDIITSNGNIKHIISKGNVKKDANNKITGSYGTAQDITERKIIERELIKAKEKAEESDRLKSAFLANMSHEIRTPMNGILGFTSLLQDSNLSVENQKKYIDIIKKSGDRLLNTVNDIIEISKIESGDINVIKSKVDIIGHLDTQVAFFKPEAEKKGLEIFVKNNIDVKNLPILIDKNKLSSILSNLIKNAIKYTNEGTIKVGLKIENSQILFSCHDTGIGIPKHRQEAIFNRFEQADIEDKQAHQGSGLGLAIVKTYVEMLDGSVWVESEEGKGSTFYVSLPYEHEIKKEQKILQEIKSSDSGIKNINVLVVEDDEISVMHLSEILNGKINNISTAQNGIEAIDVCKNDSGIDLILMDLKMPKMDGIEATKKIREFNKDVIIIAQTAYALEGDKEKALNAGCNDYISKPINKVKLFELINKYF